MFFGKDELTRFLFYHTWQQAAVFSFASRQVYNIAACICFVSNLLGSAKNIILERWENARTTSFVYIQLLSCSQANGIAQVDPSREVVIQRDIFASVRRLWRGRCWDRLGEIWAWSEESSKPLSPEMKQGLPTRCPSDGRVPAAQGSNCTYLIICQLIFSALIEERLKGNPIQTKE